MPVRRHHKGNDFAAAKRVRLGFAFLAHGLSLPLRTKRLTQPPSLAGAPIVVAESLLCSHEGEARADWGDAGAAGAGNELDAVLDPGVGLREVRQIIRRPLGS